jgi:predicted nucleic acid-binding protein
MLLALDTNVLVYAEGGGDARRKRRAEELLIALPEESTIIPVQVLGELYRVLVGKYRVDAAVASQAVMHLGETFQVRDSSWLALQGALELTDAHQLSIWDSLIFSVAAEHRCRMLLSEDLQEGFTWRGVTVVNPFSAKRHALLAKLLGS